MKTSDVKRGALAGLITGVLFGIVMQFMFATTPAGSRIPMMQLIAEMAGSMSIFIGWAYHLFDCAVIGAIFGAILGSKTLSYKDGLKFGPLFGLAWWILGGLILKPFFMAMSVFAPESVQPVAPLAFASLVGHVLFGLIVAGTFVAIRERKGKAEVRKLHSEEPPEHLRRAQ